MGENAEYREASLSAAEVHAALRLLIELGAKAAICEPQASELVPLELDLSAGRAGEMRWRLLGPAPRAPFAIRAAGRYARYELPVTHARVEDGVLVTACPASFERVRSRRARRASASVDLRVVFEQPGSVRVARALFDLSHHGLSFAAAGDADPLASEPAIERQRLFVERACGESIELQATIACRRFFPDRAQLGFGCRVVPASAGDAARWLRLSDEQLFRSTRRGAADVWNVYRTSGYFGLADTLAGSFEPMRAAYLRGARALQAAPQLGCQATWPALGEPRATVTNLRLYPDCWLSFHLAAQPDQSLATRTAGVLRALYEHHLEHGLATGQQRFQLAYVQQNAHWSRRVHVDFMRRYAASGEALVRELRVLELRTLPPSAPARERGDARNATLRAAVGTPQDVRALMPRLRARLPAIYCDALCYDGDAFALEALREQFARCGLERARDLLVAGDGHDVLAVGVVECAEPGLHLFGLLDTVRLYDLAANGAGARAFPALLDAARAWFRARERRTFCYLEEEHPLDPDGREVKSLGAAYMTLLSAERLPEQLESLYCDTAGPA